MQQHRCVCVCVYFKCLYSAESPFLLQASRQFDQEGRKKFFTLDMNNILLEWVGQLLNHHQLDPSPAASSLFCLSHLFSVEHFPRYLSCCRQVLDLLSLIVCINYMLLVSIPRCLYINLTLSLLIICIYLLFLRVHYIKPPTLFLSVSLDLFLPSLLTFSCSS